MNALKALKRKKLKNGEKLVPGSFFLKYKEGWSGKVLYANRIEPHVVYATINPPFQHDISDFDFKLYVKKQNRYMENELYLGHFKVLKD
jgi:hypothetical protein